MPSTRLRRRFGPHMLIMATLTSPFSKVPTVAILSTIGSIYSIFSQLWEDCWPSSLTSSTTSSRAIKSSPWISRWWSGFTRRKENLMKSIVKIVTMIALKSERKRNGVIKKNSCTGSGIDNPTTSATATTSGPLAWSTSYNAALVGPAVAIVEISPTIGRDCSIWSSSRKRDRC